MLDEFNRITEASYSDGTTESFGYDPAGNRTTRTGADGTTTYTYDPAGQLVSSSGPDGDLTFTHDSVGRLTAISDGTAYAYNTAGQLTQATIDGTTHTYSYDADGIRVDVDGQAQLWDRNRSLPMLVGDGDPHTWGPDGQLLTTGEHWAHNDALGSVRAHTNTTGDLTASVDYRAFGTPTTSWDSFGYTGGHHDPTGLIHLRARQHHPGLGRFTTRDPIQPGAPGTGGYNHYTYVANNPTTWTDPTGQVTLIERAQLEAMRVRMWAATSPIGVCASGAFINVAEGIAMAGANLPGASQDALFGCVLNRVQNPNRPGGGGRGGGGAGGGGPAAPGPARPGGGTPRVGGLADAATVGVGNKISGQMCGRGWTHDLIDDTLRSPSRTVATRDTRWTSAGTQMDDPATAYIRSDGTYAVRNDVTGDIVQISNRNDPNWVAPWD